MTIRILLIDPHTVTRLGIKQACAHYAGMEFVGETAHLREGLQIAKETKPDVAVIDLPTHDAESLKMVKQLHEALPSLRTLVFTARDDADAAEQVFAAGASGYLIKAANLDEIVVAIRSVNQGRVFISHSHHRCAVPSPQTIIHRQPTPSQAASDGLSKREQEVLSMIADGMTNKQAAAKLFLSVKTVETYRARIMKKFQLADRAALVHFARRCDQQNVSV